ncbi:MULTISPECIES: hypothetical protein [unclassified Halomonas]|uniref:hypothetical protein n=1 Tax=unclassified Halomonas TaxID=2609666 RepID=UPI00099051B7|nr:MULTISPECIES: hypothetical protein [unclassified Halomonas]AQU84910.1 hypothetical protein B2G49_21370 [Halomonas sp. 'Soap Lake \
MTKLRGLLLKNGALESTPSLPPVNRVAFLVDDNDNCKLTPLTTSFLDMDFPVGVFTRVYEEMHYLDKILYRASSVHAFKKFEAEFGVGLNGVSGIAANALRQLNSQNPFQSLALSSSVLNGVARTHSDVENLSRLAQKHINAESLRNLALSQASTKVMENLEYSAINVDILGGTDYEAMKAGIQGALDSSMIEAGVVGKLNSSAKAAGMTGDLGSIAKAAGMASNLDSIARAAGMAGDQDSIARAAGMAGNLDSIAKAAGTLGSTNHSSFIQDNHQNPYASLLKQVPKVPKFEDHEARVSNHIDGYSEQIRKENERQAKRQKARDELQREQVELSAKHLKLNAEQFEESKRVRAKQDRTEKYIFLLTAFVAIVTTLAFIVAAISLFFEAQEIRAYLGSASQSILDLFFTAKNTTALYINSLFEKDL